MLTQPEINELLSQGSVRNFQLSVQHPRKCLALVDLLVHKDGLLRKRALQLSNGYRPPKSHQHQRRPNHFFNSWVSVKALRGALGCLEDRVEHHCLSTD